MKTYLVDYVTLSEPTLVKSNSYSDDTEASSRLDMVSKVFIGSSKFAVYKIVDCDGNKRASYYVYCANIGFFKLGEFRKIMSVLATCEELTNDEVETINIMIRTIKEVKK